MLFVAHPAFRQDIDHVRAGNLAYIVDRKLSGMLRGHDDGGRTDGLAIDIAQGHLALGVGAKSRLRSSMAWA